MGVERVASKERFLEVLLSSRKDWRRLSSWFHSLRAAVSAAWIEDSEVGLCLPAVVEEKELTAIRDFWIRMRVLRRASKVERCCLTAFPFAMSAFVAAEMVAITDF